MDVLDILHIRPASPIAAAVRESPTHSYKINNNTKRISYLRPDGQTKLAHSLGACVFATVVVHGPRTSKGETGATRVWVEPLASTGPGFIGGTASRGWKTVSVQFVS